MGGALLWGLAAALLLSGCLSVASGPSVEFREVLLQGEGDDKILLIDISGPIVNQPLLVPSVGVLPGMTARIRQELELAFDDPDIRGILLRINSPGGTLTDSDVIYHSLMEFKRSKKVKIVASMGDIAASGGVYV
ncbi:MAG: signal peptide peptidase SppA, partial [Gammaproteobacteria bacterium]|nr:signal peptide peptidase SppA [Gammaproteobacteria bacterium]NIY33347.1 signal peptide peptidase SppA [Gammaproteobacteria bacterium]